jgi:hypothetical protein
MRFSITKVLLPVVQVYKAKRESNLRHMRFQIEIINRPNSFVAPWIKIHGVVPHKHIHRLDIDATNVTFRILHFISYALSHILYTYFPYF